MKDSDGNAKAYDFDRVRLVKAATSDANAVYAATYKLSKENVNNNVQYNLWLVEEGSQGVAITVPGKEQAAWTGHYLTKDQYITDPAKIYEMMFDADINDYLTAAKDSDNVVWKLTGKFAQVETNSRDKYVNVTAIVERAEKYTVYSFGANNSVVESYAWLTDKQVENTAYSNQDYTGNLAKPEEVIKATAADLGVAEVASVDGAQAKYAYAKVYGNVIECTYKLGDATAELADFATTTGAFNAEAYFGRDAKANDKVLLKVSLSAQGEAKGLDASKISVEWNTYGTKAAGDAFFFEATEAYKAGAAQSFVLTEGTAVVTATVSYNGKVIGTFAPFYATVA